MQKHFLSIHHVSFSYINSAVPIIDRFSGQFEPGWTGIVGANGSGKTTLLKLCTGLLNPVSGKISLPGPSVYCEQRTDEIPEGLPQFIRNFDPYSMEIKSLLCIEEDWAERWHTLSHGERKRAQVGLALFRQPEILALDEPTNHLDKEARQVLFHGLKKYRGIGLLVSHDRLLLDRLCHHILWMEPPRLILRQGNYSSADRDIKNEKKHQQHQYQTARRQIKKLRSEVKRRKQKAAEADKKRSKKQISKKDHDAKSKIDLARLSGKDGVEGRAQKRLETQMNRLVEKKQSIHLQKTSPAGIRIEGTQATGSYIFHIPADTVLVGQYPLVFPDLFIQTGQRIGLAGPNGSGKSTLVRYLVSHIPLASDRLIYIPQEINIKETRKIIEHVHALDSVSKGQMMSLVSRLGSDPVRILETELPSPGEVRKLILAAGIQKNPHLIIMDEPTNHMDLPSIQHVETALVECGVTLLLVSHDGMFLDRTVQQIWRIDKASESEYRLVLV